MKQPWKLAPLGLCLSGAFSGTFAADTTMTLGGGIVAPFVYASEVVTTPKWEIVPDSVFDPAHSIRSLEEVEAFVRAHRHLPDFPSARQIGEKGMNLTQMNLGLLKTVEELTLHVIDLDKRNRRLEGAVQTLQGGGPDSVPEPREGGADQGAREQARRQHPISMGNRLEDPDPIDSVPGLGAGDRSMLRRRHQILHPLD